MTKKAIGYRGLLGEYHARHWLLVVMDFDWEKDLEARVEAAITGSEIKVHFIRIRPGIVNFLSILSECLDLGLDPRVDYVSIQVLHCSYVGYSSATSLAGLFRNNDLCRVELPLQEMGFRPEQATQMIDTVCRADYCRQDSIARRFFSDLSLCVPYEVVLGDGEQQLRIADDQPWMQIAGKLVRGERRLLPGGEVAYTGDAVTGSFTADGAILPTPQTLAAVPIARRLFACSELLQHDPVTFDVENGRVVRMHSKGSLAKKLTTMLDSRTFCVVTEVGIGFNDACNRFVHEWPASSNEGHPGVHIGIGGEPAPTGDEGIPEEDMVHADFIAKSGNVTVNGRQFMSQSYVDV